MCSWKSKQMRLGFFWVTCGKTSKINSNLFSITFSTSVFWSQHASSPLLSPFNRWLKHMEICRSVSQIKCNNEEKNKPRFLGKNTFGGLYLADLPPWSTSLLPSFTVIAGMCVSLALLTRHVPLCACEDGSTAGPQAETRRQGYYCCLSRKKAD